MLFNDNFRIEFGCILYTQLEQKSFPQWIFHSFDNNFELILIRTYL